MPPDIRAAHRVTSATLAGLFLVIGFVACAPVGEGGAVTTAAAQPGESELALEPPGDRSPTGTLLRTPGTLPPGIEVIPDSDYSLTDDLHVGEIHLPSGRVIVGEYLFDAEALDFAVAAGAYPAHATLARYAGQDFDSVAFATLVLSTAPTVRWVEAGVFAVDGGSTTITSVEGRDAMRRLFEDDEDAWMIQHERIFESIVANDYLATEFRITPGTNLASFSSGAGDGSYPVFVGYDDADRPTRVVVDFYLLHLAWPGI